MKDTLPNIQIQINESVYLKNPESSDLGRRIVTGGIDMIDEIGFEKFTFRKLAKVIKSTEASVYRYFESKHKLLIYLTSWYWGWMEYRLVFLVANVENPETRLERALLLLTDTIVEDSDFSHINEVKLHRIVISESSKAYLTKEIDHENQEGFFKEYKAIVARIADIILEINPSYLYPHMLVSTVIEGSHHQHYFAQHLPLLTDVVKGEDSVFQFYKQVVFNSIKQ